MAQPSYPKSVREIDAFPYPNARFSLGGKLHQVITFCQNLHTSLTASGGGIYDLVNEIRTALHTGGVYDLLIAELRTALHTGGVYDLLATELRTALHTGGVYDLLVTELRTALHTGGVYDLLVTELRTALHTGGVYDLLIAELRTALHTGGVYDLLVTELRTALHTGGVYDLLIAELRTRLHTGGDYQLLLDEIRTRLVTAGDMFETLVDVADRAYNQCIADPAWVEEVGTATNFDNTNAIDAIVDGVYIAALLGAGAANATPTGAWNTGVNEQKTVTLALNAAGDLSQTASAVAVHPGPAPQAPRPPSGEVPVGIAHVPPSFTAGVTQIVAGGVTFTDGFPRRTAVPVTVAAAATAAIAAGAPAGITAPAPTGVTAPAPTGITAPAPTGVTAPAPSGVTATAIAAQPYDAPESLPDHF